MSRIDIKKGKVGVSTLGGYERTSLLVGSYGDIGAGTAGKIETGKAIRFYNLIEAESYGVKSGTLLHHQISEYFRMAQLGGNGASLYILNIAKPTSFEALVNTPAVKQAIIDANGEIFNVAFDYIPTTDTAVDGLNSETLPAMAAAQNFADSLRTDSKVHCVVSGADFRGAAVSALDLRAIKNDKTEIHLPQVSLCIAQDYDFAETLTGKEQKYAAVGALLGCMAAQSVGSNIGEVATMILTNATRKAWINAGLSSHVRVKDVDSDLETLNKKGYIFGEYYSGQVVFNDDHNCVPVIIDTEGNMNEHTISLSRTNAKVFREIFKAYQPKLKATVPVDAKTGKLEVGMLRYYEDIGNDVFDKMTKAKELSGGETSVDPESNLLYGEKELNVFFDWVPMGTIGKIKGTVNIKSSL